MANLRQQLPPLDALVMFDAAARHLSFTLAANELNITQAAVSRQIRLLEENLGIKLFIRAHRAVELSPEGRAFQHSVRAALVHICDATSEVRNIPQASLVVAVDQAVAGLWLMPRLSGFLKQFPGISIRLVVSDSKTECLKDRVDVAIIHGDGDWPGFTSTLLFPEEIFPVCSPECIVRFGPLSNPAQLTAFPLIEHEDERWDWMNWRVWLTMNNVDIPSTYHKLLINNYAVVIQAAKGGQGVALGWRYLVDDLLESGELVRPFRQAVKTKFGYYLIRHANKAHDDSVETFSNWVFETHRQSETRAFD